MKRRGTSDQYLSIVKKIREVLPDCALRTTFLTGFAGETDSAQENTKKFLNDINFDWSGCFPYSKEEDTHGYKMRKQVPEAIAKARAEELELLQADITKKRLALRCGKEYDILIEEVVEPSEENESEGLAIGRAWFQAPEVDGNVVVQYDRDNPEEMRAVQSGRLVRVKIVSSGAVDLDSVFISDSPLNKNRKESDMDFAELRINSEARGESQA